MTFFDVLVELFSEFAFDFGVAFGAFVVDVDFPADAAGVGAFAGGAMERIVKSRNAKEHVVKIESIPSS